MGPFAHLVIFAVTLLPAGQDPALAPAKPTEHVVGTLTGVDKNLRTITVKEDSSGVAHAIQVGETKTLLKVAPGAKDVKGATRITADDLEVGDRVDVRGFKVEADPGAIAARSVILMSGRDVQQAHQAESAAWAHASAGTVTATDATTQKLTVNLRGPGGVKPVAVDASHAVFTRFSPEQPQTPTASQFAEIQSGDQVRILGDLNADGSALTAQKIYSGTFKNTAGTVVSLGGDGKSLVVKDLGTKQPVSITLSAEAVVRKLPPMMATMLARRFNPDAKAAAAPEGRAPFSAQDGAPPHARGNGDLSQMLERLPTIPLSDLKPGDAVVVSGSPLSKGQPGLLAIAVIAGVEPIFQSASPRQAQSLGDWNAGLGGGAGADASAGGPPL